MKIAIIGSSGFIGSALVKHLSMQGHTCLELHSTYKKNLAINHFNLRELHLENNRKYFEDCDYFVNLAGHSLDKNFIWTNKVKQKILSSRIETTKYLVDFINSFSSKKTLLNASAVGVYPSVGTCFDEDGTYGDGFLSEVCREWEEQAMKCHHNLIIFRLGVVIDKSGGIAAKLRSLANIPVLMLPNRGKNHLPWISLCDVVSALNFLIDNNASGKFNFVVPAKHQFVDLIRAISKSSSFPWILSAPISIIKIILGEKSRLILDDQSVIPRRLQELGYQFRVTDLASIFGSEYV